MQVSDCQEEFCRFYQSELVKALGGLCALTSRLAFLTQRVINRAGVLEGIWGSDSLALL